MENANRLLADTVLRIPTRKMYKTGDYANWDSAFREISINRKDRQIKLHSFRFNLDDLEALSLKAIPECGVAAMVFRDDNLLAEYHIPSTSRSALDELDIKTFVGDALIPSRKAPENHSAAGNPSYGGRQTGL
ncbi:hypothetical protein MGU_03170 [Metarhizium guizhouense ARSEF 977]|uniref:Uncharacterized protein n=1 Tax=Metarhizium guizhouense (strain ARSEF 977) TaxID=1276136 RepID=A0A0B4GR21_METGA|nr:hypothetical protein MGU_03170 [Metarhizium guizhouense ARSEF 977]